MDFKRLWRTIRLNLSNDKGKYLRRAHIFEYFGKNSTYASRKIPLYPELIYIGDNVRLAANVLLVPHDMAHAMLNNIRGGAGSCGGCQEQIGCIKIDDDVFVGANTIVLANVYIGKKVIIGAGSLVNKDLPGGYVYAGVPAKKISTFEQFWEKRKNVLYPKKFKRKGDSIDFEFAEWLWNDFCAKRKEE